MGFFAIFILVIGGAASIAYLIEINETNERKHILKRFSPFLIVVVVCAIAIFFDATSEKEIKVTTYKTDRLEISSVRTMIFDNPVKIKEYKDVYPWYASIKTSKTKYVIISDY